MRLATTVVCSVAVLQACTVKDYTFVNISAITVSPANSSIPIGGTQQFTATGTLADGSTQDVSSAVSWSSTDPSVATIDGSGTASALAAGTTTIQASSNGVNGTTQLRVVSLTSIAVTPANPTIALGGTQQLTATGTYSDGTTTQNLTSSVTWTSSLSTVATVSASGLATGVGLGATTIRAQLGSIQGTTTLTVRGLLSITVNPPNPSILMSDPQQFQAIGHFNTGPDEDITQSATWRSDTTSVATINNLGLARGVGAGMSRILARSASVEGSTTISVTGPTLIAVTPSSASITMLGRTQQFMATGTFLGGPTRNLTDLVSWSSLVTTVATVNPSGLAFGLGYGGTLIRAATGSVTGSAGLTVGLTSLFVTPAYPAIPAVNGTRQFTADGGFPSVPPQQDITAFVGWTSTVPTVATIVTVGSPDAGLATGLGPGGTTIQAASGTIDAGTGLTVALATIAISPLTASIPRTQTQQFTATGTFTGGPPQNITNFVSWSSSNMTVATINASGLATALAVGTTMIGASSGTITQGQLATLTVTP